MNLKTLGIVFGVMLGVVIYWPGEPSRPPRLYNEAELLYGREDYEGAIAKI